MSYSKHVIQLRLRLLDLTARFQTKHRLNMTPKDFFKNNHSINDAVTIAKRPNGQPYLLLQKHDGKYFIIEEDSDVYSEVSNDNFIDKIVDWLKDYCTDSYEEANIVLDDFNPDIVNYIDKEIIHSKQVGIDFAEILFIKR